MSRAERKEKAQKRMDNYVTHFKKECAKAIQTKQSVDECMQRCLAIDIKACPQEKQLIEQAYREWEKSSSL